jgi:diguanylate cyclase (GGDEF)-like protein
MRIDKNWSAQATTLINLANPRIVERLTSALTDLQVARKMAETDALTGLYNRSGFVSQLSCAVAHARTHETPLGVLMIDVDKFKEVNDTCGHATGDAVLRAVARAIAGSIAPGDAAFRYGGDEFIVILPDRSSKECCRLGVQIKDEIRRLIRELFTFKEVKATVSIGVTALSPDADENSLLTRVDAALYRAKEQGRDAVVCDCPV